MSFRWHAAWSTVPATHCAARPPCPISHGDQKSVHLYPSAIGHVQDALIYMCAQARHDTKRNIPSRMGIDAWTILRRSASGSPPPRWFYIYINVKSVLRRTLTQAGERREARRPRIDRMAVAKTKSAVKGSDPPHVAACSLCSKFGSRPRPRFDN